MLDHRNDFYDPDGATSATGIDRGAAGVALLPKMSRHPSVVELERCISLLRATAKNHCAHMLAFYGCEWRTVWVPVKTGNGKWVVNADGSRQTRPERRRVVPGWVLVRMVERGVDFVVFAFTGEVFVPDELIEAA